MSDQIAEKEPLSGAGGTSHNESTADRLEDFLHQLESVTSLMTSAQRAENVLGLGLLGEALRRAHAAIVAARPCPPALVQALGRCLDRLEPPMVRILSTAGRAQRARYIQLLAVRAAENGALVAAIGRYVEPDMSGPAFRSSLVDAVQTELMLEMCERFDAGVARLTDLVVKHRGREELRNQRFDDHLEGTTQTVAARLDAADRHINSRVERAAAEFDRLKDDTDKFRSDCSKILEQNYLVALLQTHQQEEDRERTASLKRELAGLVIACVALVPLTFLFFSPTQTSVLGWLSHLGPASLLLAVATYCLRKAANHRREALDLRNKRLGMDTAFRIMSDQLTDEQRRNMQQHVSRSAVAAERAETSAPVPESISVLPPLDRLLPMQMEKLAASVAELIIRKEPTSDPGQAEIDLRDRP